VIFRFLFFLICLPFFLLVGCGSVSTKTLQETSGPAPLGRPEKIVVLPFDSSDCVWGLEVSSTEESMIRNGFPDRLAISFVEELKRVAPASKVEAGAEGNAWLVQGRLRRVMLPDPALKDLKRKPLVECTVFLFDLNRSRVQPFLTYTIVAKDVYPDPLVETQQAEGTGSYLALEAQESARLLGQSLKEYIKGRGWSEKPSINR
jgi:hypothetical protein